ncbi:D-alanyl-D-alanine carboxypeptidase/D-alanyl-D-alanine endopeptidase [Sulfurovum mangrovi]|uniref:D-alanyl-D-alanine carboxypeptidase/D-alanyl-D-alanine endopeptidase n=1 Tax=Sulfurovum mangrovi TaxID=2893889 RepID=UPI001E60ED0C|nr:D-alanyl-D-alanine carboxypeptidase/D-alanyl-D-alanine-endopeptidase [Sulfurovum mangrovi]UFH59598.1 D-alanyl-D-alanine carboxypeptidase/D-alanyl-D-alanine-endopeptidase [Sulfurovum mangrovi]UFH60734.1 D-alanyl-D-alanine carboxypeptidase/D-alanyl-D-alanine-endopeptidase [Sulfurovum mangrovi]
MRGILIWFVVSVWLFALPADIQYFLNKSKLPSKDVSIYIKELGSDRVVASLNADKIRKPASVIKVVTAYGALLKMGFDYRWPTQFYTNGALHSGSLEGDLVVKGHGDPSFGSDDLPEIVEQIKQRGIHQIHGDVVIDRSYFDVGDKDSAHFDNYPYSAYNAWPDAMMFNERTSTVCITPRKKSAHKEIEDPSYKVVNRVKFVNRSCRGKYAWAGSKVDMQSPVPQLILTGELSKHCKERQVCKIVTKPYKAFYYALKEALEKEGIKITGGLKLSRVPPSAKLFYIHRSEPLEEIISKALKESNNIYARHLLLLTGAKVYGAPATVEKGRKAVINLLKSQGALRSGAFFLDNGSGLSRRSEMSARMFSEVYESAYRVLGTRWMETLSIAGKDGTIKQRYRYKPAQKRAWMKTGTLKYVKNIGGYVKDRAGNYYSVVILVNTKRGRFRAVELQDSIINWLAQSRKTPNEDSAKRASKQVDRPATIETKEASSTPKKGKKTSGNYYIQIASVTKKPDSHYLSKIEKSGFSYKVVYEKRYKVLIGGYPSRESAQKALPKIRQKFNKGAFIVTR